MCQKNQNWRFASIDGGERHKSLNRQARANKQDQCKHDLRNHYYKALRTPCSAGVAAPVPVSLRVFVRFHPAGVQHGSQGPKKSDT